MLLCVGMDETHENKDVVYVVCVAVCVMLYRSKELIYLVWLDCVLWMLWTCYNAWKRMKFMRVWKLK